MAKIVNKVYRLRYQNELQLPGYAEPLKFVNGQEFHIVNDVLYMGGHPVPMNMQKQIIDWITGNPHLFIGDTRQF